MPGLPAAHWLGNEFRQVETLLLPNSIRPSLREAADCAAEWLDRGEVVALPTETVYGLAGDALNAAAAARIFEVKERPHFDPLICHLPDREWLDRITRVPASMRGMVDGLAARFWPGPLTLVLPKRDLVPDLVSSGLSTVAVRMSAHPVFGAVLERFGRPVAAPSANRFGRISPTQAEHVVSELGGRIPLVLDGGPTHHGVESTIVALDASGDGLRILRAGPVTAEELEELAPVRWGADAVGGVPEAPGQLKSHYAPRTPLWLREPGSGMEGVTREGRWGLLAWREQMEGFSAVEVLSARGDLREAAATLFAKMRRLDEAGLDGLVAERVPEEGLGCAINDRLKRASAR
ncbi:MAG: Threonylcarbamoyl-AMP synthase [Verrucomicrobiota bacterium]